MQDHSRDVTIGERITAEKEHDALGTAVLRAHVVRQQQPAHRLAPADLFAQLAANRLPRCLVLFDRATRDFQLGL